MKHSKSRLGMSILAGSLSFVGSANAIDLITNGSFENPSPSGWQYFSTYTYSQAYFAGPPIPASENPGSSYSWRQSLAFSDWDHFDTPTNLTDFLTYDLRYAASQSVYLTNAVTTSAIDANAGQYTFSTWMSGYAGGPGPELPCAVLRFFNASGGLISGADVIFDRAMGVYATTFASGVTTIPSDLSGNYEWVKYVATGAVPSGARTASVYLTRSPSLPKVGSPDTYIDLVKLDVININDTTVLDSVSPPDKQVNAPPDAAATVTLRDLNAQVDTNSIVFQFDGQAVTPSIAKNGVLTTVQYDPPGLMAPLSSHTAQITWTDSSSIRKTNAFSFQVAAYVNILTGPLLYQETFDEVSEGSLPAGWSVNNSTDQDLPGADLNNFHSDSYLDWVVISRSTLSSLFNVTPGGADYTSALNVAPLLFLNNLPVTNLIDGNFAFAASTDRFGNQVQHLTTGDYDLSGKTGVALVFNNIYAQNQNSLGAVEYSIDGGSTWLPALYMLTPASLTIDGQGNIDAASTFAAQQPNTPPPGNFGAFISVAQSQWASTAPFISPRTDDDLVSSMRIEAVRLAQADNQPAVRLRFTQAGQNSYYFGMDNFSLYSTSANNPPVVTSEPASQTVAVGNAASFTVGATGMGPISYQWRRNGANLAGKMGATLPLQAVGTNDAGSYDVVITGGGGAVTSAPMALLTVITPAVSITGQWDFNGNLAASYGSALLYGSAAVSNDTTFGTTASFGLPAINGQSAAVMHFVPSAAPWNGYQMFHGASPNGGGAKVNQYTLIYDVYYPGGSDGTWRSLIQTTLANNDDADFFVNPDDGIGISSIYDGLVTAGAWHRIAFAFDLSGPGTHPVLTKFIDGVKVAEQTDGLSAVDGRFALFSSALLFADNDGDTAETYVSSVQFSSGRQSDAYLSALGGPSANKIPGLIRASMEGGQVVLRWTGGVPLLGAEEVTGPWTQVNGASSPYTPTSLTQRKFYRPSLP